MRYAAFASARSPHLTLITPFHIVGLVMGRTGPGLHRPLLQGTEIILFTQPHWVPREDANRAQRQGLDACSAGKTYMSCCRF